ncbi:MAG: hypothetical protein ACRD4R_15010 [Candidatus Acidiferrales bacterium]
MFPRSNSVVLRIAASGVIVVAACALIAPVALAFHHHLTSEQVRAAYFIGRDQNGGDAFLAAYTRAPQQPNTGPNVQSIEFWTPYERIAARARDNWRSNYFPPDAEQDYAVDPIHEVIVRVLIFETYTFSFPPGDEDSPESQARLFKYRVSQDGRELPPDDLTAQPDNSLISGSGLPSFAGIDVHLHFDVSRFHSSAPVTVEVIAPTGQTYSATFDLASLQ